ncbi:CobW family GTP-binding protein [Microbacterium sp.]|uniref:CobW family GTP-binding protein n=1 Tax=Microbacterium sp. TaxID=51671 RepID=UPI003F9CEDA8
MTKDGTARRVPVVAITGYLGSGKTTLLNHLLRQPGARIGVIVNDFGELNVDAALITGQIDEAATISGGCLCCLPDSGGLDDALERLSHPRLHLDAIIIEASGAADPITLHRLIRFSGAEHVRPGGIIEVIDAVEHFRTVDIWPDPPARYAVASLVVIGKGDLLEPDKREDTIARIMDRVRARNPQAQFVVARHGRIDPDLVFDIASDEDPPDQLPIGRLIRDAAPSTHDHEHAAAVSLELPDTVSPTAIIDLLEHPPKGTYRIKGRVRVRGPRSERGYLVNLVGTAIHIAPLTVPPAPGELVAIGMHLDRTAALEQLTAVKEQGSVRPDASGLRRLHRYRRLSE